MKKGVVILIVVLALVVIVSPGIIGKMSEQSLDENLNRAVDQSGELVVTSQGFDRGWFSSAGEHRIELGQGSMREAVMSMGSAEEDTPVLVINTRIDHGIIPVTSMTREKGSLRPGLGSSVSTMMLEFSDGNSFELPGEIYSSLALNGGLESEYAIEAGSETLDQGSVEWLATNVTVESDTASGGYAFDGSIGGLALTEDADTMTIGAILFSGEQAPSGHGFFVGDVDIEFESVRVVSGGTEAANLRGLKVAATNEVDDGRAKGEGSFAIEAMTVPDFGEVSIAMSANSDTDAGALGRLLEALDDMQGNADPAMAMMSNEEDAKDLFAAGVDINVPQFDVTLPMGKVEIAMSIYAPEQDRDGFEWTSLLLKGKTSFDLKVPEAVVQLATSMNPQAGGLIAMGYLRKEGDYYIMDADMEQGLLTINGAPIPIPMGMF